MFTYLISRIGRPKTRTGFNFRKTLPEHKKKHEKIQSNMVDLSKSHDRIDKMMKDLQRKL